MNSALKLVALSALAAACLVVPALAASSEPGCAAPAPCQYNTCIKYKETLRFKRCMGCKNLAEVKLVVQDPCCSECAVEVPVCLPACCTGEPCVSSKCGLCGRGVVCYAWDCGVEVKIVLSKCGDITVVSHYR